MVELNNNDKQRIEQKLDEIMGELGTDHIRKAFMQLAEYATIFERQKEGERCPSLPECYAASKKLDVLEAERADLLAKASEQEVIISELKKAMQRGTELYANLRFDDEPFTPYQLALQQVSEQSQRIQDYRRMLLEVFDNSKKFYYLPHPLEDKIEALLDKFNDSNT